MWFSWRALILAPPIVPAIATAVFVALSGADDSFSILRFVAAWLFLFVVGCIISYGVTVFAFLPALWLTAQVTTPTLPRVSLLGFILGTFTIVPIEWMMWKSSGPDSGPPEDTFISHFMRDIADPILLVFPVAGLLTATIYWWIATRRLAAK